MAVIQKTYIMGDTTDYEYTHPGRYGAPGEKRKEKLIPTPGQVLYQNRKNKAQTIRRLIKTNFTTEDWFLTLTWSKDKPKDMKEAYKDFENFIDKMRDAYRKFGKELKYIYAIEIGSKGGIHIHLVINDIEGFHKLLKKYWNRGHPNTKNLYEDGDYRELGEYLAGMPKRQEGKSIVEAIKPLDKERYKYNHSRNLEQPIMKKKRYMHWKMRKVLRDLENMRATPGYYIDKDSIRQGINPFTGLTYLSYSEHRIRGGDGT